MDKELLQPARFAAINKALYGENEEYQLERYRSVARHFSQHFGGDRFSLFSSPGRTEIGGNHTDHNGGMVLTASVTVDAVCAAEPSGNDTITLLSHGFQEPFIVDIKDTEVKAYEKGTAGLVRGICAGFKKHGLEVGGFNAYVSSNILFASGLSSSAAFEMLITSILNEFFNGGAIDVILRSKIGQFAENVYWNKPSGLLDQMGCGVGGIAAIDFRDRDKPVLRKVNYEFSSRPYKLLVVNTGGNHADLTNSYAQIPEEMWKVAKFFGAKWCADISRNQVIENTARLRQEVGDRAILRALHFFDENERVEAQINALERGDIPSFLSLVNSSGHSSWRLLQNCYEQSAPNFQPIPLCLALIEEFFRSNKIEGACRVHGGGFAGVVLVIVHERQVPLLSDYLAPHFGKDSISVLGIRQYGAGPLAKITS